MRITDCTKNMSVRYGSGGFDLDRWKEYISDAIPGAMELCLDDMNEVLNAGISWDGTFLPVLNAVREHPDLVEAAAETFHRVTYRLDDRIKEAFGKTVDADIYLYLGLCSGAGWVTEIGGRTVILLGIEKIIELGWYDENSMNGLILHELGHCYQSRYGILHRDYTLPEDRYLWQLFTEGIANVFERLVLKDPDRYPQYSDEWMQWCDSNVRHIAESFKRDLETMSFENQRYFGDWVRFEGWPDTGYYLGMRLVRYILKTHEFDEIIGWTSDEVRDSFESFMESL